MRIISGIYKGLKLKEPKTILTRPTMDRVKESLFGIIQSDIKDSVCLDLFAGTGSLGLEALSNGANTCYFVDNNKLMINLIEEFTTKYSIKNVILKTKDYDKALLNFKDQKIKFDIIFLDPPYNEFLINKAITKINEYDLLNINGIIVCEYEKENINCPYELIKEKNYGSKNISIYKRTQ